MASARKLPLSYNPSTYGDGTRGYQDLATWEVATDNDPVTAQEGEVLFIYDDAASFDDGGVTISDAIVDSDYFRAICPAIGEGHNGTPNSGVYFNYTGATSYILRFGEDYFRVHDLIARINKNDTSNYQVFNTYISVDSAVVGCIIFDSINSGSGTVRGINMASTSGNQFAIDNLIINSSVGIRTANAGTHTCYNNTITGCGVAFENSGGTCVDKNSLLWDNTTNYSGAWTSTTNLESDTDIFVDSASDDYHLAASDNGNGTDLGSDFDDDLDGELWTNGSWGRGALKYISGAPSARPLPQRIFSGPFGGPFRGVF